MQRSRTHAARIPGRYRVLRVSGKQRERLAVGRANDAKVPFIDSENSARPGAFCRGDNCRIRKTNIKTAVLID